MWAYVLDTWYYTYLNKVNHGTKSAVVKIVPENDAHYQAAIANHKAKPGDLVMFMTNIEVF